MPERKQVRSHIFKLAGEYHKELKKDVQLASKSSCLAIKTEIWTDGVLGNPFLDSSLFYVDESFKLKHALIAFRHCSESHTPNEIFNQKLNKFLHFIKLII